MKFQFNEINCKSHLKSIYVYASNYLNSQWNTFFILINATLYATVQCKGNLTHADRADVTYWPKACGYINRYWRMWQEKPANIISVKDKNVG